MNPMNGLLLVDKDPGLTSHDVVHRARCILGMRNIGHAGTLDPLASGLLLLLLGEATKISDYLLNSDKSYECKVRLGIATDSMDITGQVLRESPVDIGPERIRAAVESLQGELELAVPVHSAVKVDGRKLYELAHRGESPEVVPIRSMRFYGISVLESDASSVTVRMSCSKGSFIRAWANRLGEVLGCGGTVEALRRVSSQPFGIGQGMRLEELERRWEARTDRSGQALEPAWVALRDSLPHFRRLDVSGQDEYLLRNGQISKLVQAQLLQFVRLGEELPPVRVVSRETDDLIAILLAEKGQFYRIKRVFHRA